MDWDKRKPVSKYEKRKHPSEVKETGMTEEEKKLLNERYRKGNKKYYKKK